LSTRILLEGTDIRNLLQEVRDGYGPEARIVHAERIRSGGMGGFFAKQRYEVTVEVDADAALSSSASAIARSINEEQPAVPDQDEADAQPVALSVAPPAPRPVTQPATAPASAPASQAAAAHASALLTALVIPDPLTAPIETIDASTPRASAPSETHEPFAPVPADPVRAATPVAPLPVPTTDSAMYHAAIDLVLAAVATGRPDDDAVTEPTVRRRPFVPPSLLGDELALERATRDANDVEVLRPALTKVGPALEEPAPVNDLAARLWAQRDAALAAAPAAKPAAASVPVPVPHPTAMTEDLEPAAPSEPATTHVDVEPDADTAPSTSPHASVELDVEAVAPILRLAPSTAVDAATTTLAVATPLMPRRPGDLLVLLGDAVSAYAAARTMAAGARIPAALVHVVSDSTPVPGLPRKQRLHDVLEARLAGAQLAMNRTSGIVVIDAPLSLVADPFGQEWVGDVLDALDATTVWAVVDATRRTEDIARWLSVLPDPTGLVVHDLALTSDPEAVHTLGVPVAIVDGKPVAPAAEPVTDRGLSAAAIREAGMLAHPASRRRTS
jgi:hypothetical protein